MSTGTDQSKAWFDRAKTARGSFELTRQNAQAVAAICRRLDGLPLALELAASRLRILSPESLLERLDHALQLLTSGPRDRPVVSIRHGARRPVERWRRGR